MYHRKMIANLHLRAVTEPATMEAEPALEDSDSRVQTAANEALLVIYEKQRRAEFWTKSE